MMEAVVIDDEISGSEAVVLALAKYCPEVTVTGVFNSPVDGIKAIVELSPQVVFLDVQMPGISGFDILQRLSPLSFEVIFVSAHDQYAIQAIRFSALDYLLKPVDPDDLIHAVRRVKERLMNHKGTYQYQSVLHNVKLQSDKLDKIAVPNSEGIDFFDLDQLIYCESDGSYTKLVMLNKKTVLVSRTLKEFESLLEHSGFCRVHHSFLINLRHVKKYIKGEGGYALLTDNHHVDISRRKKESFLKALNVT